MNPAMHTTTDLEMSPSEIMEAHFELDDLMDSFKPGILYGLATPCIHMLKTILIPGASLCAVPLVVNKDGKDGSCNCPKLCKPSELPIYGSTNCCKCQEECKPSSRQPTAEEANMLERGIRNIREGFTDIYGKFQQQKYTVDNKIQEGAESVKSLVVYLREDASDTHRLGAIAMGGLTGLIFGLRGGMIKKLVYMSAGAGGMYYVCYPEDAELKAREGFDLSKQYIKIAYNFMYGEPEPPEPFDPEGCCPKDVPMGDIPPLPDYNKTELDPCNYIPPYPDLHVPDQDNSPD